MAPAIAKLGHVELVTPDIDESVWFFRDVIGLKEVERDEESVYLRARRDLEHHTLTLTAGDRAELAHVGWQTWEPEHVDAFADRLDAEGIDVRHLDSGEERGQGRAIRFRVPAGHEFELYYDIRKPDPPEDRRSRLKNRVYSQADGGASIPERIDHVQIRGGSVAETNDVLMDTLGFRLIEYAVDDDGDHRGGWLTTNSLAHTIAYLGGDEPTFHHVAYYLDSLRDLWNAADAITEHGVEIDGGGGPSKHGITNANFMHVRDPGSGHRIELFNGSYHVFNPDWEPVEWDSAEMEKQPWFGTMGSQESTPVG